ncbi:gastrula zinc finger protein XlCGF57.1-like isoform X1 [Diorhabda carinulata]|uniref:gastrula zinc finger protein XlCGF57.1-like isoform X1 n=2 Tax=Diorhabda carinulata TaxID=1163345 RepID=UPI0025A03BC7|nr:gastrula zinc finger protein XlCGF57.1-like isoform X1 [Diorhabda carinulata]
MDTMERIFKNEIDIQNDWNIHVEREMDDEAPKMVFQNMNTRSIKQEINDELNTVDLLGESFIATKSEKDSFHEVHIPNIQNKFNYPGKRIKSKDRMDMEQTVIKDEIEIHNDFICYTNIKQELSDEIYSVAFQNVNTISTHPIKQEISNDFNTTQVFEKSTVVVKTEECSNRVDKLNISNKFKSRSIKTEEETKSQGMLKNGKYLNLNRMGGIIICELCGNLYTKLREFLWHFFTSHYMKKNRRRKEGTTDISVNRNLNDNVKTEIEIVEDGWRNEKYNSKSDNTKSSICGGQKINDLNTSKNLFQCNMKTFSQTSDFKRHLCSHTGEKPFKCDICSKSFLRKFHLIQHLCVHTGEKKFECDICLKKFSQINGLKTHLRSHTGEKPFKCDMCAKTFSLKSSLNLHLRNHTGEKPFKCDICLKTFLQKSRLKEHLYSHAGKKPFKCEMCLRSFSRTSYLRKHLITHKEEKTFKCDICSKSFSHKFNFNTHLRSHTEEKPFKCEICMKTFLHKHHLNRHLHSHTGEKPFKCDICLKTFKQKRSLSVHLLNHTEEKTFKCEICLKSFSQKSSLKPHLLSHTKEKLFKCQICSKTFLYKYQLNRHLLTHTGEKPFKCDICLKTFTQKNSLNAHLRNHTKKRPFKCDICSKSFSLKYNLKTHLLSHTGD